MNMMKSVCGGFLRETASVISGRGSNDTGGGRGIFIRLHGSDL